MARRVGGLSLGFGCALGYALLCVATGALAETECVPTRDSLAEARRPRVARVVEVEAVAGPGEILEDGEVVEIGAVAEEVEVDDDEFEDFDDFDVGPPPQADPFEGVNRQTHRLNEQIDTWVLDPITWTYRKVTPDVVRDSLRNFFWNLGEPTTLVNDLLQREWDDAAVVLTRLVVNSTLGVAGLFDPATSLGLAPHDSDFGQTMALAGVGSGPYLVLPVVGPSNVRDGVGLAIDVMFRPSTYVVPLADQIVFTSIQGGGAGLTLREEHYDQLKVLKESSIDYYSALRSAYAQNRDAEIWDRREHHRDGEEPAPAPAVAITRTSPQPARPTCDSPPSPEPRTRRVGAPSRTRIAAARSR